MSVQIRAIYREIKYNFFQLLTSNWIIRHLSPGTMLISQKKNLKSTSTASRCLTEQVKLFYLRFSEHTNDGGCDVNCCKENTICYFCFDKLFVHPQHHLQEVFLVGFFAILQVRDGGSSIVTWWHNIRSLPWWSTICRNRWVCSICIDFASVTPVVAGPNTQWVSSASASVPIPPSGTCDPVPNMSPRTRPGCINVTSVLWGSSVVWGHLYSKHLSSSWTCLELWNLNTTPSPGWRSMIITRNTSHTSTPSMTATVTVSRGKESRSMTSPQPTLSSLYVIANISISKLIL